jgi:2,3-bisphosphoglycerate-dependent phosphoglycerate mutase
VVGLVTHGHFSQFLLRALLGIPTMTGWVDILNTSVSRFADVDVPGRTDLRQVDQPRRAPRSPAR